MRSLGVNEGVVIEAAMQETDLDCCLLAGRHTLPDRDGADLLDKTARRSVAVVAGGVFNSGILAGGDAKFNYVDAPPEGKRCVSPVVSAWGDFGHAALQLSLQEFGNGAPK